eukprot:TRINITY_DN3639_c0_g1_i1.p1 TRINITY_DN3639_c0_g1~~TRINITY_DN3639_c0_g1_i1.p1  ORF type:complete len:239 (-),score=53.39 TRINITY_DN3639_c0_g1_i1:51-686(-)
MRLSPTVTDEEGNTILFVSNLNLDPQHCKLSLRENGFKLYIIAESEETLRTIKIPLPFQCVAERIHVKYDVEEGGSLVVTISPSNVPPVDKVLVKYTTQSDPWEDPDTETIDFVLRQDEEKITFLQKNMLNTEAHVKATYTGSTKTLTVSVEYTPFDSDVAVVKNKHYHVPCEIIEPDQLFAVKSERGYDLNVLKNPTHLERVRDTNLVLE